MTIPAVGDVAYPTVSEIRDQILADLLNYGLRHGLTFNVLPGSEHYILAQALANRIAIAIANNQIRNNERDPLIATGTALQDFARVYGVTPRPASTSAGFVNCNNTVAVAVPAGKRATAPNGKKIETVTAVVVPADGTLEVRSVNSGADANFDNGTIFQWDDATLPQLGTTATANGDIDGAVDADNDDTLRRRLLDRLSFIAAGGNAAAVKGWAEEASSSIEAAYVYPCAQGPGSYDIAVVKAGGDRTLAPTVVALAGANVLANMPGGLTAINATTVYTEYIDVILGAELALPSEAGGAGGGWRDAAPWPAENTYVTSKTSTTITVNATTSPSVGNRIGIWNADDAEMYEYEILSIGGGAGAWVLTLDQATSNINLGSYVSAGAVNLKAYAATALAQFEALGPGEKTDNTDLLPRAARQLPPDVTSPYKVTAVQIGGILAEHEEILDLEYAAVYDAGTTTPKLEPSIPATPSEAPRILVLNSLAIRKMT